MKGEVHVEIQNKRIRFEFDLRRNITVIRGDSATGKTTLISMIDAYANNGAESGIELSCEKSCLTINNANWKAVLASVEDAIIFADEEVTAIKTVEFARAIRNTDNYYVFITRENLPNLPYSVEEVYGIHISGKYADFKRTYNSFYRLYPLKNNYPDMPVDRIIVEDSNSGFDFYRAAAEKAQVISAEGKSNIRKILTEKNQEESLIIADGAAFGSEMGELFLYVQRHQEVYLYLPESFEWIILASGLIDGNYVSNILEKPMDYIESRDFFSWEQFFTKLLIQETKDTYLQYSKHKLNNAYLNQKEKKAILEVLGIIRGLLGCNAE
ncbi:MAG: translation initiation factor 2 [Oscillospiraceae bacterium]|nr:translation initiation factor 2 [Oscillospiraceae bacterium]